MKTIKSEKQFRDIDLFVNTVNSDPQHIARAKAKRERVMRAPKKEKMAPETAMLGAFSAVAAWTLALVALV